MEHKIKLGAHVKDRITGLEGVATVRVEYINGCVQYGIRPTKLKDGQPVEASYVDQQQIEVLAEVHKNARAVVAKPTGGPSFKPGRSVDSPPRR